MSNKSYETATVHDFNSIIVLMLLYKVPGIEINVCVFVLTANQWP